MADIDAYLQAILSAIYGREVRGSIHDAIEAINNEVVAAKDEMDSFVQGDMDATLTSATLPAQAKAVGDAIAGVKTGLTEIAEAVGTGTEPVWSTGMYIDETSGGELKPASSYKYTNFINCETGLQTITLDVTNARDYQRTHNAWYDKDKNFISSFNYPIDTSQQLSIPANARYFRLSCNQNVNINVIFTTNRLLDTITARSISRFYGKKVSIIGDSIDTFNAPGFKINGYNMYYPALGVDHVNKTWWKKVIDASGAALEINASWSGSRVTDTHSNPDFPDFYDRVSVIGNPDIIFVSLGTNDSAYNVSLGEYDFITEYASLSESTFRPAYIKGMKALQALYPAAKIIALTEQMEESYKESINYICYQLGITCIDASDYTGVDGVHPGPVGMDQIARLVLFPTDGQLNQRHMPADSEATGKAIDSISTPMNVLIPHGKFRNGSANNLSNLTHVTFDEIIPIETVSKLAIKFSDIPLADDEYYEILLQGYSVASGPPKDAQNLRMLFDKRIHTKEKITYIYTSRMPFRGLGISLSRVKSDFTTYNKISLADVENGVDFIKEYDSVSEKSIAEEFELEYAQLNGTTGAMFYDDCKRLVSKNIIRSDKDILIFNKRENIRLYVCYYSSDGSFLRNSGWINSGCFTIRKNTYFRVQFAFYENVEVSPRSELISPEDIANEINVNKKTVLYSGFRNGSVFNANNVYAVSNENIIPTYGLENIKIELIAPVIETASKIRFQISTYSVDSGITNNGKQNTILIEENRDTLNGVLDLGDAISECKGVGVAIYALDESGEFIPIRTSDAPWLRITYGASRNTPEPCDYLMNAALLKTALNLKTLGSLTYSQAFLIKDGFFYSTDGSHIAKQDFDFNLITEKEISAGHGNSLQLGADGYGYISGWNDNNLYKVNLDTLTVEATISLPTTGYTTAAVDTQRGIAYIFQRETYPSTNAAYNFIVYDYINSSVIDTYTAKTPAFGAMQACDFYDDRIMVLSGMGRDDAIKNAIRIYDISGNVIASYHLNSIAAEYEGVCIDRGSGDMYISIISGKRVYKITQSNTGVD